MDVASSNQEEENGKDKQSVLESLLFPRNAEPLVYDWLRYIEHANKKRLLYYGEGHDLPFMAIPAPVVKIVFKICRLLKLPPNTRYLALELFDRFTCLSFMEAYKNIMENGSRTEPFEEICIKMSSHAKIHLMSCIQIASKIESHKQCLSMPNVLAMLAIIDPKIRYTSKMVLASEHRVFKMVNFTVPKGTALDAVEALIAATNLIKRKEEIYAISGELLDLAYLQHEELFSHIMRYLKFKHTSTANMGGDLSISVKLNVMFLGATVVLCANVLFGNERKVLDELAVKFANIAHMEVINLWGMTNVLMGMSIRTDEPSS